MKRLSLQILVVLLLIVTATAAQNITVSGTVRDSLQNPLDMANIVAINQQDQSLDGFGITNPKGLFKIKVKANASYVLKISYLGFSTKEITDNHYR